MSLKQWFDEKLMCDSDLPIINVNESIRIKGKRLYVDTVSCLESSLRSDVYSEGTDQNGYIVYTLAEGHDRTISKVDRCNGLIDVFNTIASYSFHDGNTCGNSFRSYIENSNSKDTTLTEDNISAFLQYSRKKDISRERSLFI